MSYNKTFANRIKSLFSLFCFLMQPDVWWIALSYICPWVLSYISICCYEAEKSPGSNTKQSSLLLTYASVYYIFIYLLPLQGENKETKKLHGFSPKTKVPGLWRRLALYCPPESTSDPPQGILSEVTLRREEMPACLIEALRLHIHVLIGGGDFTHQTQQKVECEALPFLNIEACLVVGTPLRSVLWFRELVSL